MRVDSIIMTECAICIESYNRQARKEIQCPYCAYSTCSQCCRQYLLGSLQDPHCMNCRRHWNREVLAQRFPMTFLHHDYKSHRENVLYDRERSLLPSTQPAVAAVYKRMEMEKERDGLMERFLEHKKHMDALRDTIDEMDIRIRNARYNARTTRSNPYRSAVIRGCPKDDCRGFIQKDWKCGVCSVSICNKCHEVLPGILSGCAPLGSAPSGFAPTDCVPSGSAPTGLSEAPADCVPSGFAPSGLSGATPSTSEPDSVPMGDTEETNPGEPNAPDAHTCKPENIETAKLILSQTRPCPKCSVPIYKIDGCDQMFCTQCHTAFSWRSGEIVLKNIHNPHYYEWQRQNTDAPPREPGDIPCGGVPGLYDLRHWFQITEAMVRADRATRFPNRHLNIRHPIDPADANIPPIPKAYTKLCNLHRLATHIEHVELPGHREPEQQMERNEDLRIQFLMNQINEDQLKFELQKREKKIQKKRAIYLIYDMFLNTVADLLRNAIGAPYSNDEVSRLMKQLNTLRVYFNDQAKTISRQFNSRVPNISENWDIYSTDYKAMS